MTIKLSIALLLLTVITVPQDKAFEMSLNDPSRSFNAPAVSEIKLSKAVLAEFKDGDFVHPTFSPDGKVLALSKVLVRGDFENTEIRLFDLSTHKDSVLLDSKKAETYAAYKAFVTGISWTSARRLEVHLSDGDVGMTHLLFDPYSRKLLRETTEDLDETDFALSPAQQKLFEQARSLFPSFPREVLENALKDPATLVIPGQGIVLQKNYAGHDDNVWFLNFHKRSIDVLIKLPADSRRTFMGGFSFNSSIVLLLSGRTASYLVLYRNGEIKVLGDVKTPASSWIEVKHASSSRTIFLVRTHAPSERGDNPLFVFDGEKLLRVKEYPELHDTHVDPLGRRIAYCYWEGDKRHVAVRELN